MINRDGKRTNSMKEERVLEREKECVCELEIDRVSMREIETDTTRCTNWHILLKSQQMRERKRDRDSWK